MTTATKSSLYAGACALVLCVACAADSGSAKAGGSSGSGSAKAGGSSGSAAAGASGSGTGDAGSSAGGTAAAGNVATTGAAGAASNVVAGANVDAILKSSCAKSTVKSALLPSNLLFVLDRSGSMACNPPPTTLSPACESNPVRANTSAPSKWEITTKALVDAIKMLPSNATIGISYFSNDDSCGVDSTPSVPMLPNTQAQQSTISASLTNIMPAGGTPLVGATVLAYKHMHEAALAGNITGNEFVVLITDGQQSDQCNDPGVCTTAKECTDFLVNQEVPKAAGAGVGIRTFAIGVPGSEPARTVLSQIAQKGGTGKAGCDPQKGNCHFDMTMEADLSKALATALTDIAGQANACELSVPQPAKGALDLSLVNVVYTPGSGKAALLRQDAQKPCDTGADGWQYSTNNTKIRLCGAICDTVRGDTGGRVDVVLGCPIVVQ
ncbi:MAG TPA: VWA domain-containing protein [Polyangiales bacterium]